MNVKKVTLPPFRPTQQVELKTIEKLDKVKITKGNLVGVYTRYLGSYSNIYKAEKDLPTCLNFFKLMASRYDFEDELISELDKALLVDFINEHRMSCERIYTRKEHVLIDEFIGEMGLEYWMKPISRYFDVLF